STRRATRSSSGQRPASPASDWPGRLASSARRLGPRSSFSIRCESPRGGAGILSPVSSIRRVHPAWIVLGAVTVCMMAGSGIRSTFGVYIKPMEAEFGWGRSALSGAAAVSLLLLGAAGPLVGRLADRWGPRRIVIVALLLLGFGSIGGAYVQSLWHVYVTSGFFMALGAGGLTTP